MPVVRFSQRCSWGFRSSGIWRCISEQSDPDVSRASGVLIFKVRSFETCWRNVGGPRKIQTNQTTESPSDGSHQPPAVASATAAAAATDDDDDERYKHKKAWSIIHLQKNEFSDLSFGRPFQCPSGMIRTLNSNIVVKVLNHFNLLTFFLRITDMTQQRVFYKTLKQRPQFKTSYNCTQFILCILHYWPEDGPQRSKHIAKLKIYTYWLCWRQYISLVIISNTTWWQTGKKRHIRYCALEFQTQRSGCKAGVGVQLLRTPRTPLRWLHPPASCVSVH